MAKIQEKYEVLYIVDPRKTEEETAAIIEKFKALIEETAAIIEKFKALIEENATIDEVEDWGKRHLAYEIDYQSEGYYELVKFTAAPEFPAELKRILSITEGILRYIVVKTEG